MVDLSRKYGDFLAPTMAVKIDGTNLSLQHVPISFLQVSSTTAAKADSFQFRVEGGYNPETRTFDWVGKTIRVGKEIVIQLGYKDRLEEVFDGYVTGISFDFSEDGEPAVTVRGMDRSMFLMRGVHSQMWSNVKVSDVVKQIATLNSLSSEVDDTGTVKPTIEQMQTSDFLFLKQLAQDVDYEFFILGRKLYFRKRKTSEVPVILLSYGQNLFRLSVDIDISTQISKVVVRSLDPKTNEAIEATSTTVDKIGENPKTGKDIVSSLTSRMIETVYSVSATQGEAKKLADAIMNERSRELVTGEGRCVGLPELRAGRFIKFEGLGKGLDQPFVLREVTHTLDDRGFFTTFQIEGNAIHV
jgi:hypothetical protein